MKAKTPIARAIETEIGGKIRLRRNAVSMSQETLGAKIGVTFQQVQKYEKGTNRVSISRGLQIAKVLECKLTDFLPADHGGTSKISIAFDRLDFKVAEQFHRIDAKLRPGISNLITTLAGNP